ncbi:T9SS type A sorting domain-containing protein [Flavicella sp.]|uniref:T9SS type A sorting domain-containing protein n=1 Tax=Flavicella sp. TaxID=2957742 RepID=UPI00301A878D
MKSCIVCLLFLFVNFVCFSQSPGGVGTSNMSIWYSGDSGISDSGTLNWTDRSSNGNSAEQSLATNKAIQSKLFNFNQTFTFDGVSDYFSVTNLNYSAGQSISNLSMFVVYATGLSETDYDANWSFLDFDRSESFNFYIHGNGVLAMSYQSEGTQDLVASTASNDNVPHLATFIFDSGETIESIMRLDGFQDYSGDNTSSVISVASDRYGFVGDGSEASSFGGSRNNYYYDGEIAEIIFYDKGDLTTADIVKIETYLALKYGITLDISNSTYNNSYGDLLWDNLTYWNDVAGLVQDDAGALDQRIARSSNYESFIVAKDIDFTSANNDASRTSIGDGKSLIYGHNNQTYGFSSFGGSTELLFNKTWLFQEKNSDVGTVYIAIEKSFFVAESVDLIVSSDDIFDESDTRHVMSELGAYYYVAVNISDNEYVSFVLTTSSQSPGGVDSGLEIWLKSDSGVTASGGKVSDVFDQTYHGYDLIQTSSTNQPSNTEILNFNPSITFDGTSDRMPIKNKNYISTDNLNQVYVWTVFNTDFSNSATSGSVNAENWAFLDFDRNEWFNTSVHGDGTLQFHFNSGGQKDNFGVELTNDGTNKLGGFIFDLNAADSEETKIRVNGNEDLSTDVTDVSIHSNNTRFGYVGDGSEAASFDSSANNVYFQGEISEVVYYENQSLTDENINMIESYLAVKYGITLDVSSNQYLSSNNTIIIWDDLTYWNDIGVIGKDEASGLNQKQSKSTNSDAILTVALGSTVEILNYLNSFEFDDDLDFFAWGNNDSDAVISEIAFPTVITGLSSCSYNYTGFDRDWKVKNTGAVSGVTLEFDLSAFINPGDFYLIIDEDGNADYSDGTIRLDLTGTLDGTNLTFSNIDLNDGEVFTLIRSNPDAEIVYETGSWTGGNSTGVWDDSGTDLLKSVNIKETVTLSSSANCKCLKVDSGAVLTVPNGSSILASDILTLDGDIYLYGDSQLVQTLDGIDLNSGEGKIYIKVSEGTESVYRFNYWGSPVKATGTYNLNENLLTTADPNNFSIASALSYSDSYEGSSGVVSRYWLNEFTNSQSWSSMNENTNKVLGSGFTMKGQGSTSHYVFAGKPTNGTIELELDEDNYYLVGNPYPSVINADDFNTFNLENNNTTGVIYYWNQETGDSHYSEEYQGGYATRAGGVGTYAATIIIEGNTINFTKTPNAFIGVGQGFMVTGETDGNMVVFKNSFRDADTALFLKSEEGKQKSESNDLSIIRLGFEYETSDGTYHRQLVTSLRGLSTMDIDIGYDAPMFDYYGTDMYWDLPGDYRYVINSVPLLEDELEVPLGVVVNETTEITIKLDNISNYTHKIYLLDKEKQSLTDLNTQEYSFLLKSGTYEDRYSLLLRSNEILSVDKELRTEFYTNFNSENNELMIVSGGVLIEAISLYSLVGNQLISVELTGDNTSYQLHLERIVSGVYILHLKTPLETVTKKIIITKN